MTYYGLLPKRDNDTAGFAMGWGKMTNDPNAGRVFFNGYLPGRRRLGERSDPDLVLPYPGARRIFLQPNLSYIPDPARVPGTPGAFPLTIQAVMLF